ncbi:MAG: biotin--[Lachnospiraceae bacterium]|nr:biotin--[acetyl-CoA-carboxylase] ligase [Lachnospiraceae bacterium]
MWTEELLKMQHSDGGDSFFTVRSYQTIDSTNEEAKRLAARGAAEGLVCAALEQTAGKGRRGRSWESPMGESVYMSVLLRPEIPADRASMLTLVMGLSAAQGLSDLCGLPVRIKWPNDVVIHGKKLCGILTEASVVSQGRPEYVVTGIGINVNNTAFPEAIRDRATSLRMETGRGHSPAEAAASVLARFSENYRIFLRTADLCALRDLYEVLLAGRGETVRIEDPQGPYTAEMRGIDGHGALIVNRGGSEERIISGEVSVRGLYGYI